MARPLELNAVPPLSGDLLCKPDDCDAYHPHLSQALRVCYQRCNPPSNVRLDQLLATPRADPCGYALDNDEFTFDPELLLDASLFHPLAADVASTIIIHKLSFQRPDCLRSRDPWQLATHTATSREVRLTASSLQRRVQRRQAAVRLLLDGGIHPEDRNPHRLRLGCRRHE